MAGRDSGFFAVCHPELLHRGAVVQVANSQIFTTERDHWARAEASFLAQRIAALMISTPDFRPPSTCKRIYDVKPLATSACWSFHQAEIPTDSLRIYR